MGMYRSPSQIRYKIPRLQILHKNPYSQCIDPLAGRPLPRSARQRTSARRLHLWKNEKESDQNPGRGSRDGSAAVLNIAWRGNRTMLITSKIEAPPCHFTGIVSWQTSSANVRSHGVDRACRRDAYVSHKRCTAITAASHAS